MQCHEARAVLVAWVDGELSADETRALDAHLGECDPCRALATARRIERDRWRTALRDKAPSDLRREILAGHASENTTRTRTRRWLWAAAAAVVLLIAPRLAVHRGALVEPFSQPSTLIAIDAEVDEGRTLVLPGGLL